ncbi:MAG TPA: pyridoxal phosphate-dependent aminotransferase [Bacteroidota bacterium]|nr:pyridoxal phosphate-dependent aminotransferase [Bacteroidota bacterium]
MDFSRRTNWYRRQNRLADCLENRRASGKPIIDLTSSNPTECGFHYPHTAIIDAFSTPELVSYQPDPHGLILARKVVSDYYQTRGHSVDPSAIFLTASSSEAYSHIFKLLCNVNDTVLVPQPSYPLFEYLAQINDVHLDYYHLIYDNGWHIDFESIRHAISSSTKAIVIVNPHNPTGMFVDASEYSEIRELAIKHNLAIIVDEVFIDYSFESNPLPDRSYVTETQVLTFTLNGIAKMLGLPQMKLGWMIVGGPPKDRQEVVARMEILCDTFLSVNTPVQLAFPPIMAVAQSIHQEIARRVKANYKSLRSIILRSAPVSVLENEGGWYSILKVPNIKSDEQWTLGILEKKGVYVFPGYFFDFEPDAFLVVSLLIEEKKFISGIQTLLTFVQEECGG